MRPSHYLSESAKGQASGAQAGNDEGPDCEDPVVGRDVDDISDSDDDGGDGADGEGAGDIEGPEIDDDLDDRLYPGL